VARAERRRPGALRTLAAALAAATLAAPAAHAQGLLFQGVADVELWKTDDGSTLLARNEGRPAPLGRVNLWAAWEAPGALTLYVLGEAEGGPAVEEGELEIEQAGVRWAPSRRLVADAGMLTSPVGAFAARRLSNRNPLIGAPDGYPVTYPLGVQLSGALGRADWRVAAVSLPVTSEKYTPEPTPRLRPAVALGFAPAAGLRIGASYTEGAYLNDDLPRAMLAGRDWCDYRQRLGGLELQASRGYLELWAEAAWSDYEVPGVAEPLRGTTAYMEGRYTFGPRLYAAVRAERNDYPYIQPDEGEWTARNADVRNVEAGIGFRPASHQVVKLSTRLDSWHVAPELRAFLPDGYAVALQFSQSFDVMALVDRARGVR
jgi:hypothetical protein